MEWMKEAVDYVIFGILGLMGFIALWLTIERMLFLKRYRPGHYESEEERSIALTKNFTTLYIIYSNAPYVGLLGTVIGIMLTFYDMGSTGAIDAGQIMTGSRSPSRRRPWGLPSPFRRSSPTTACSAR